MTGTTIAGTYLVGITLSDPALQDPATITDKGSINVTAASGSGLYGTNAAAWSVYNSGTVIAPTRGVFLTAGGAITNFASGVISGGYRGIDITGGAGTVTNAGSIGGSKQQGIRLTGGGTVSNLSGGTITGAGTYAGADLLQGGTVSNASGGTIINGVEIDGAPGTLNNDGLISGGLKAVYLSTGGAVTNGGTISGYVEAATATATVTNTGSITAVTLSAGGTVSNASTGTIVGGRYAIYLSDGGTVINGGLLGGGLSPIRAIKDFGAPFVLTNLSSGQISANVDAIAVYGVAATIINAGTIGSSQGITLTGGGTITNQSGGTISGIGASGVTIDNDGVLQQFTLTGDSTLLNTGTISNTVGAYLGGGSTLTNAGTITLSSGRTLAFGGAGNRLVLDAGGVVSAGLDGGNIGSALELAVGDGSAGSLAGFGSSIVNFSSIAFDSSAEWTIAGQPSGLTGLMTGFAQGDTIDLVGLSETISTYASGMLTLTGDHTVTLRLPGSFSTVSFTSASDGSTGTDVFLAGSTSSNTYVAGLTLSNPATQNPTTIASTITIGVTGSSGAAIYGTNVAAWSVYNSGTLVAPTRGVFLTAGGTITNFASGVIGGGARGIDITAAAGSVTNAGSIGGNQQQGIRFVVGGTVSNLSGGTITGGGTYAGVDLVRGGAVSNAAGGTIINGVEIDGASGTVSNSGVISRNSKAVYLSAGGLVTNAGTITGDVEAVSAAATVANLGVMAGITLSAGGAVSNATSGTLNLINIYLEDGGSVTNAGVIGGPISPIRAIEDHGAPLVLTNLSSGEINGNVAGIAAFGVAATIANAGTINGRISLTDGGTITNQTGGTIDAVTTSGTAVVGISNDGVLQEFSLSGNGILLNSGTIRGAVDSYLGAGSTLTNLGTITLNSGRTLEFGGANDLLVLNPNAPVDAAIDGGNIGSALELAVGNGSAGSLAGFGSSIVNFSSIAFDSGAKWTIAGQPSGLTGLMTGFAQGDTIDLVGLSETISGYAAGVLTLTGDQIVTLQLPGSFTPASFMATPDAGTGTDVFLACYVRGTRIATPNGEVAVEALAERDSVLLASGERAPIVWIGHRRLNCRRHPKPQQVWPVRVHAHAFGRNLPRRDLLLSPDHAVFVDDVLIPIRYLINDTTIRQEERGSVEYFHIELPRHGILLANGLPAESYLDIGDRSSFENGGGPLHLHPDFASRLWEAEGCAPPFVTGAKLATVRGRLAHVAQTVEVARTRSGSR